MSVITEHRLSSEGPLTTWHPDIPAALFFAVILVVLGATYLVDWLGRDS